jgi:CBS domain-containing protein
LIGNDTVKVSPLSSLKKAKEIASTLRQRILDRDFFLTSPVERLPLDTVFNPMRQTRGVVFVEHLIRPAVTCSEDESVPAVAQRIIEQSVNHIVVSNREGTLMGIVTSWDVTRAVAEGKEMLSDIIVQDVITATPDEPIEAASRRLAQNAISALPVVDGNRKILGIITSEDISHLVGGQ